MKNHYLSERERCRTLGYFEITGDKLMVTDPCYKRGTWCQGVVVNVLPGEWKGIARYSDEGSWGIRVAQVEARHRTFCEGEGAWEAAEFEVGVDSGQAGIFDEERYPQKETGECHDRGSFYNRACEATLGYNMCDERVIHPRYDEHGAVMPEGVVTCSGYGDGGYKCEVHKQPDGKVDAVRVTFIGDEDEDDDLDNEESADLDGELEA